MKTIISKGTRAPAALFSVIAALLFLAGCNSGESTEALPNTGGGSNTVSLPQRRRPVTTVCA